MHSGRIRIAHVMPTGSVAGSELATLRIARAVEGPRFTSVVFCPGEPAQVSRMFAAAGFSTVHHDIEAPRRGRFGPFFRACLRLARDFRRRRIHLVHSMDPTAAGMATVAAKLAGVPVICHVRNRCERLPRIDRVLLRGVDGFVYVSRATRDRFGYRPAPGKGRVIYDHPQIEGLLRREGPAAPGDVRAEFGIPPAGGLIGMVARVHWQKDFETLIRAAARVVRVHPDARFLLVGDHSASAANRQHFQSVSRQIEEHGLAAHFIFTGFRADVSRLLEVLDIFVLSTHWEGLPHAVMEAMAHGKPVVVTAVDGVVELVRDGKTGLLFPDSDHRRLAEHLLALLADGPMVRRLGEAGRRHVEAHFREDRFAAQYLDLYSDVIGRVRRPEAHSGC